jgi:hypothetical protein
MGAASFWQMAGVNGKSFCNESLLKPPGAWLGAHQQNKNLKMERRAFTGTSMWWLAMAWESSSCVATWMSLACWLAMR